jgi:hypothetical protein
MMSGPMFPQSVPPLSSSPDIADDTQAAPAAIDWLLARLR